MRLPHFPDFEKLSLVYKDDIEVHIRKFPPYSDFNFSSMWAWDVDNKISVSELHDNLVVAFTDYNTKELFYSFLGENDIENTIETLIHSAQENGFMDTLLLIPEHNFRLTPIKSLEHKFIITEDRDNHDYILSVAGLSDLKESTYQKKRNLALRFQRDYPSSTVSILPYHEPAIQKQIESLFFLWEKQRGKERKETENELKAIRRILATKELHQLVVGIYDGDVLISFSLSDISHDAYAVTHFEKSNASYPGLSTYIKTITAQEMDKMGCSMINYEQDFGFPGLRQAKELLHPIGYLKKFSIQRKML
jgi:hypothetical protein